MKSEPLLEPSERSEPPRAKTNVVAAIINLIATSVGTGVVSIPISMSYTGLMPGLLMLCGFAWLSDASLRFLALAAFSTHASSYAELGERVYGLFGRKLVLWLLLVLLFSASVTILICIVDLIEMLAFKVANFQIERVHLTDEVALPDSANRWITAHLTNRIETLRHQRGPRARTR